jgi:hypothetical protein
MNTIQLAKTAQSIFNRYNRNDAASKAETLAIELIANLDAAIAQYGITDEFDLIEAIALDIVKSGK